MQELTIGVGMMGFGRKIDQTSEHIEQPLKSDQFELDKTSKDKWHFEHRAVLNDCRKG